MVKQTARIGLLHRLDGHDYLQDPGNSGVIYMTIYIAIGLRTDRKKDFLGLCLGKTESASFWLSVLTDLKS